MRKRKLKRHLREAEARRDNFEAKLLQLEVDYDRIETAHRLDLDRLHIVRDQRDSALEDLDRLMRAVGPQGKRDSILGKEAGVPPVCSRCAKLEAERDEAILERSKRARGLRQDLQYGGCPE